MLISNKALKYFSQTVFFILILVLNVAAAPGEKSAGMGRGEINFNPMGFLQFGPIVDVGLRAGSSTFIDAHFRWAYAGVVYQAIETDGFSSSDVSPTSGAAGLKVIYCFLRNDTPHCMYIGGIVEYTWGGDSGTDEDWYPERDWKRTWSGYAIVLNMGYRWRFSSGFFMQVGGMAGIHNQTNASWYYTKYESVKFKDPEGVRFIGMLEFSIGTEFGH